jgi:type II secretory pathway component PulF
LEQTPDVLDDDAVLALRFGSQSGTMQAAFEMLLSREVVGEVNPIGNGRQVWVYWIALACTIACLLMIMMVLIAPTFKQMFNEFELALPRSLQTLIYICDVFARYFAWWMLLGVVVVGLFWSSTVRRFFRRTVAPMFIRPVAQMRKAALLKLLAIGVDSGRPLAGALSTLARYHFDSRVRQRLLFARNEIEQGVESWQGLTEAGFLTPQQTVAVASAPTNEIRAWTLRRLASGMQVAAQQRRSVGFALMQPLVVLLFGAIVMFIFVSFFSVLLVMISSLS